MRKPTFLFGLAITLGLSTANAQLIDSDDCELLQDIAAFENGTSLSTWTFDNGGTATHITACNCQTAVRPDYDDLDNAQWAGVTATATDGFIGLNLVNRVTGWPADLFNDVDGLEELEDLFMGNTGTVGPPNIAIDALPSLEGLYWRDEDWNTLPELPNTILTNLVLIQFSGFDLLNAYATSEMDDIENRTGLEILRLFDLTFNSIKPAFGDVMVGSAATLKEIEIVDVFSDGQTNPAQWNPLILEQVTGGIPTITFPYLHRFYLQRNEFTSSIEPAVNDIFTDARFPALETLFMENNGFVDQLPATIFQLQAIDAITVRNNDLEGDIIPALGNGFTSTLTEYVAGGNEQFDNPASNEFDQVPDLSVLELSNCSLSCALTTLNIEELEHLTALRIDGNAFTGDVPAYYGATGLTPGGNQRFTLTIFYCDNNLLDDMPTLKTGLTVLRMQNNYFNLDDVFNAVDASETALRNSDGNRESDFIIGPQYLRRGVETRNIDMSLASYSPVDAEIVLTATEVGTGTQINYDWRRDDGSDNAAEGDRDNATYEWSTEADPLGLGIGHTDDTWFCNAQIDDGANTGFYDELTISAGHTTISFNTEDDNCDYPSPPASTLGNVPPMNNNGQGTKTKILRALENSEEQNMVDLVDSELMNALEVYPNPTDGEITIRTDENIGLVRVYDLQGRIMMEQNATGNSATISISSLDKGSYVLQILTASGWKTTRIGKTN